MTLDPPGRTFKEPERRGGVRDVDAAARAERFRALAWALAAGVPIGGAAGFAAGNVLLGLVLGPVVVWAVVVLLMRGVGRGAGLIHMPSGSSTPREKEYSRAQALAVRGEFEAAIRAYQAAILDDPTDGEAYLRVARLYRDELKEGEEALSWFRRALQEATLPRGKELRTRREVAEFLIHRMGEPRRAAPELARLTDAFPGTQDGEWAREELARIKEEMAREEGDS